MQLQVFVVLAILNHNVVGHLLHLPKMTENEDDRGTFYVEGNMATFLRMTRIAGLAPLRFLKEGDGWRVRLSFSWNIYGRIMITILNSIIVVSLISELQRDTRHMVWSVQRCFLVVTSFFAVFNASKQMYAMTACFNQVQKINAELDVHHWPPFLGRRFACIFILQTVLYIIIALVDFGQRFVKINLSNEEILVTSIRICLVIVFWILQLRILQFIVIVLHVKYSFGIVNKNLKSVLLELENSKMSSTNVVYAIKKYKRMNTYVNSWSDMSITNPGVVSKRSKTSSTHCSVHRLALMFAALCDVVRDVNHSQGLMVILMLASSLLHLICTPYYCITYMLEEKSEGEKEVLNWLNIILQLTWSCYHAFNLVILIEPCHLTHSEMKVTREMVGNLMHCSRTMYDPLSMELEQFYRYLTLNDVFYEPLKLTKMSRTLIFTTNTNSFSIQTGTSTESGPNVECAGQVQINDHNIQHAESALKMRLMTSSQEIKIWTLDLTDCHKTS